MALHIFYVISKNNFISQTPEQVDLYGNKDDPHMMTKEPTNPQDNHNSHNPSYHVKGEHMGRNVLVNNFRPVQELNGRTVFRSFEFDIFKSGEKLKTTAAPRASFQDSGNSAGNTISSVFLIISSIIFLVMK